MNFLSKLHNNSILTGSADSYCLVCENYLRSEDEAFTHTEKPIHKKNISAATSCENYKDGKIIKVKKGYYCTFCNILLSTTTKVRLHVSDSKHKENKDAQMISRVGDNILAFDEVVISREAWHGLMDNTCVLCNEEFDNIDLHRHEQSHILKLIQSKCEFGEKFVYRKVDDDSFFCLTCGTVYVITEKSIHHEDIKHKEMYNSRKEFKDKMTIASQSQPQKSSNGTTVAQNVTTNAVTEEAKSTHKTANSLGPKTGKKAKAAPVKIAHDSNIAPPNVLEHVVDSNAANITSLDKDPKMQTANSPGAVSKASKKASKAAPVASHDSVIAPSQNVSKHLSDNAVNINSMETDPKMQAINGVGVVAKSGKKTKAVPFKNTLDSNKEFAKNALNIQDFDNASTVALDKKNKTTIIDMVEIFRKNNINIDLTSERARCKRCNEDVPFDVISIENHIAVHHDGKSRLLKENEVDMRSTLDTLAGENKTKIQGKKAYSELCSIEMNPQMFDVVAHINSTSQKDKILLEPENRTITKVPVSEYMTLFFRVESNYGSDIILNNMFVLSHNSFHCLVLGCEFWTCALCDELNGSSNQLSQHINSDGHKLKMSNCNIITSLPNEFVRQMSPELYHCGFCNVTADRWSGLQEHLQEPTHAWARRHAKWNLERCHSIIRTARPLQVSSMQEISY